MIAALVCAPAWGKDGNRDRGRDRAVQQAAPAPAAPADRSARRGKAGSGKGSGIGGRRSRSARTGGGSSGKGAGGSGNSGPGNSGPGNSGPGNSGKGSGGDNARPAAPAAQRPPQAGAQASDNDAEGTGSPPPPPPPGTIRDPSSAAAPAPAAPGETSDSEGPSSSGPGDGRDRPSAAAAPPVVVAPSAPAAAAPPSEAERRAAFRRATARRAEQRAAARRRAAAGRRGSVAGRPGTAATGTAAATGGTPAGPLLSSGAREIVRERPGSTAVDLGRDQDAAVPPLGPADDDSVVTRAVREVVEVVPLPLRIAVGVLAALVLALAAYTILVAARTRRLERHRAELLEDIGLLQAALLPAVPARLGALLTTVGYRPADGPAAGGDFYDAFPLADGRVGLLLGDVSGHGRQALAKTTLVRFTVRAHLEAGMSPRAALAIAGRSLDGRLSEDFSTVIAAIHDPAGGTLTFASAGHPPPLILGPPAHEPVTASSAPPIGAGFPTGQRQTVLPMPEGTTVCLYSDGLLEARTGGEPLGRDVLARWLEELGPEATAKGLLDVVVQRADRVPDDLAACVLHAAPGATGPAARLEQLKLDVLDVEGPALEGFLAACEVPPAERALTARRVAELLAVHGGVVVEVQTGDRPSARVTPIGDEHADHPASHPASRVG